MDTDYPVSFWRWHHSKGGLDTYDKFFTNCCLDEIRLEATPDYLYSPGTAPRIREALPNVRLIFILREPVERLVSWYRFARQNGLLEPRISFEEYVDLQADISNSDPLAPQCLRVLGQGRYSRYLKHYLKIFGRADIKVIRYGALVQTPQAVMHDLCQFVGLDGSIYNDYGFKVYNPSLELRSSKMQVIYNQASRQMHDKMLNHPLLRRLTRPFVRTLRHFYLALNLRPNEKIVISPQMQTFLDDYYRAEPESLACLLELSDWSW